MAWAQNSSIAVAGSGFVKSCTVSGVIGLTNCESVVDSSAGKKIYLEQIYVHSTTTGWVTIGTAETASNVATVYLKFFFSSVKKNEMVQIDFQRPIIIPSGLDFTADAQTSGLVDIKATGYYA